jgi:hypothetical protein
LAKVTVTLLHLQVAGNGCSSNSYSCRRSCSSRCRHGYDRDVIEEENRKYCM